MFCFLKALAKVARAFIFPVFLHQQTIPSYNMVIKIWSALALASALTWGITTPKLNWKTLESIKFEKKYYKEIDGEMLAPIFTEDIKKYDGKEVQVEGYVVPVDEKGRYCALSANPYASCFFCGKAGPASVMTIKFKKRDKSYKTDDYIIFKGKLQLNYSDINEFYYILNDAEAQN